jgi:CRP-like cAMP-binding protein
MARPSTETIARVPLFAGLEKRDLERIADSFKERNYSAGDTIAGEGQGGAGFFIIAEGNAKVTVQGEDRATLGPGDYFGEIALIDEGARTATVTADTDMKTYAMTFWEFRPIVETDSRIAWKLVQALAHQAARGRRAAGQSLARELRPSRRGRRRAPVRVAESATVSTPEAARHQPAERRTRASPRASAGDLTRRLPAQCRRVDAPSPVTTRS